MDPITILGALAAAVQITGGIVALTTQLNDYIEDVRSAPKEVQYFCEETSIFTELLTYFYESAKGVDEFLDEGRSWKQARLINRINNQCAFIEERIDDFVKTFLRTHKGYPSILRTHWEHMLWVLKRPRTEQLQHYMNNTKASVHLLSTLFLLAKGRHTSVNNESAEIIRILTIKLKYQTEVARKARKDLEEYIERQTIVISGPEVQTLLSVLEGTSEIENFARKKIKSETNRQAQERRQNSSRTRTPRQQSQSSGTTRPAPTSPVLPPPTSPVAPYEMRGYTGDISDQHPILAETTQEQGPRSGDSRQAHLARSVSRSRTATSPPPPARTIRKVWGNRIRDVGDGTKISEEVGYWPTDAHGSDASLTDGVKNSTRQRPRQSGKRETSRDLDESHHQSRKNRSSSANVAGRSGTSVTGDTNMPPPLSPLKEERESSTAGKAPPPTPPTDAQAGSLKSGDESPGPWRPVPPFGGAGGRKRPPRHRPTTSQE